MYKMGKGPVKKNPAAGPGGGILRISERRSRKKLFTNLALGKGPPIFIEK
jgi:hypothetical protein